MSRDSLYLTVIKIWQENNVDIFIFEGGKREWETAEGGAVGELGSN